MGKVTIADVAARTGFSKTTISRFLNGKYEFMSEETRKRISEVIKDIEYKPNRMARSLRLQQSHMIGVIVSDISNPFSAILYTGISEYCEQHGFTVLLADAGDDPDKEKRYIQSMIAQGVDGLVINATGANVSYLNEVNRTMVPIVLADRPVEGCECDIVSVDTKQVTKDSLDLLLSKGYERILFATRQIGTNGIRRERFDEFSTQYEALTNRQAMTLEYTKADKESLKTAILSALAAARDAGEKLALFAGNGVVLSDMAYLLRRNKLRSPDDVGLFSYDNWPWMDSIGPGISVIELPSHQIGSECARLLLLRVSASLKASEDLVTSEASGSTSMAKQHIILSGKIVERDAL